MHRRRPTASAATVPRRRFRSVGSHSSDNIENHASQPLARSQARERREWCCRRLHSRGRVNNASELKPCAPSRARKQRPLVFPPPAVQQAFHQDRSECIACRTASDDNAGTAVHGRSTSTHSRAMTTHPPLLTLAAEACNPRCTCPKFTRRPLFPTALHNHGTTDGVSDCRGSTILDPRG